MTVDDGTDPDTETEKNASDTDKVDVEKDSTVSDVAKEESDESGDTSNITAEDCDNECANFKDSSGDLKYCQSICDLSPIKDSDNCESKQGTDRDYCYKNQAVSKTDINICNSISDSKIKSSCKNRVTEDFLESQTN